MNSLLKKLKRDYPELTFTATKEFCWSPKTQEISYNSEAVNSRTGTWSLLHEIGHAIAKHNTYNSDFELLQLEATAWEEGRKIGKNYGYDIDANHIEDCLDTYRDWLHQRSACPKCNNRSFQQNNRQYSCFNCGTSWSVSPSRFCRPYRMVKKTKTSPSQSKTTFA